MSRDNRPMPDRRRTPALLSPRALVAGAWLVLAAGPVWAQYKVVGPDGRVTYTDRPPSAEAGSKVSTLRAGAAAAPAAGPEGAAALPPGLQPIVARFPVTLYTSSDCEPCNRARLLLRQRGIPHTERTVSSDADALALQRLTGARTVPALAVGQQVLRGLLDVDWHATLDLAGYPKTSAMPAGWTPAAPRPLAGEPAGTTAAPTRPAPTAPTAPPPPAGPGPGSGAGNPSAPAQPPGFRF